MKNNLEEMPDNRDEKDDEFVATRHGVAEYKLNESIIESEDPEAAPSADKQWFNSDLTPDGKIEAQKKAEEFFDNLDPGKDALFFVSSDLVRAAETAKIYMDVARKRGFEVILPRNKKDGKTREPQNKAEEIGEGYIRKIDALTLDHLDNMLREHIFQGDDYLAKVEDQSLVSEETKSKWGKARAIIESDNKGSWGENYTAHSEKIAKIFPNVKSMKQVYDLKFKKMMRLIEFGQKKITEQNPEKNIKVLGFSHENSFLYFLNREFGESIKNCESISFKIDRDDKTMVSAKGQIKEVKD